MRQTDTISSNTAQRQVSTDYQGIEVDKKQLISMRPARNSMLISTNRKAQTQQWGANQSVFLGQGMEFAQSRIYHPGDDVKNIDWCVSARTGKIHTKLFQAERERPVYVLLDLRKMMHFGSRVRFKSHMAAYIAAKIAWISHDAGDRVGAIILTRNGIEYFESARTCQSVLRFIDAMAKATKVSKAINVETEPKLETSLNDALKRLRMMSKTGSSLFILSDFHDFDEGVQRQLQYLNRKMQITNIKINDPLDSALPTAGRISDGEQSLYLAGCKQQTIEQYQHSYQQLEAKLKSFCIRQQQSLYLVKTSDNEDAFIRAVFARNAHQHTRSAQ
jgi:uncharacterized protein (DUF58 family)